MNEEIKFLKDRKKDSHKGDYGHLFIIGGSPGLTGAVCLSGISALRTGCGLVTIGIPETLNQIIEIKLTEVMSLPLPETEDHYFSLDAYDKAIEFIEKKADSVLIGPGISLHPETKKFVKKIIPEIKKPLIIDADALKIISENLEILNSVEKPILTPHPGEMSFLTKFKIEEIQKNRVEVAKSFAKKYNVILILKGYRTVVTDGENTYINLTGNPGMATAGTGDVLAGIIGGILSQGEDKFISAKYGVFIHGLAGDLAKKEKGEISLIASDIIEKIPDVFKYLKKGGKNDLFRKI
ncbi:MAG: NAD(P)H-hydrate dehydratase [Candidatus Omnitrophica bacterium]|nr:NAD(P)H-hydrate dehydratase [Candidatus Omnitrophota bacterium]MCM8803017.1 NAD(P)H-hydrate dehydratase [Candidatus Omnitrophota bacterium]